jgi:hypothetical protein
LLTKEEKNGFADGSKRMKASQAMKQMWKKNSSELWVGGSNNMISFAQILKKKTGSNNNKHVCKLKHAWVELKNEENNCYW